MTETVPALKRVLLVEDYDDTRNVMSILLRLHGYEVLAFPHANSDVAKMIDYCPDVALLDVRMPGRSGDDLAKQLIVECPNVHVVFQTGEADTDMLKRTVPSCLVIRKPVDTDLLLKLLGCM